MPEPRVPGGGSGALELPCGETMHAHDLDMGLRELDCDCGDRHAVVVDVHPVSRFEEQMTAFDVGTFVDRYREEREFDSEFDTAV